MHPMLIGRIYGKYEDESLLYCYSRVGRAPICLSIKPKDRTYKLTITLPWDLCAPQTVFQAETLAAMLCVRAGVQKGEICWIEWTFL